jgi:hypothetical protein
VSVWIVRLAAAEIPLQPHEVVAWVSEGRIRADDVLRPPAAEAWVRAAEVPELRDLFAPESPVPHPAAEAVVEQFALVKRFIRTKKAVCEGQPLFDLSAVELRTANYQSAWRFNLTESTLAAAPVVAVAAVVDFLFGKPKITTSASEQALEDVLTLLLPLSAPLFVFILGALAAWASFHAGDLTKPRFWRAFRAFLYFDGAYGFFPQFLAVAGLVLAAKSFIETDEALGDRYAVAGVAGIVMFLIGVVWEGRLLIRKIPSKLFEANGYSGEVKSIFKRTKPNVRYGPWTKYGLTIRFFGSIATAIYFNAVTLVGTFLAGILEQLRT